MTVDHSSAVRAAVETALVEDLGPRPASGSWFDRDRTGAAIVADDRTARAAFVSREDGIVAGLDAVGVVFDLLDPRVVCTSMLADGATLAPGTVVAEVTGPTRALLAGERTALNLLSHLSGVATLTARYVAEVADLSQRVAIRDTRKTVPGLRALQKAAVVAGGGSNHRLGLHDGLLVKDNHVAAAGGIAEATSRALAAAGDLPVQVEVDSLDELDAALAAGARSVLLDNFDPNDLPAAVTRCRGVDEAVFVEASGGVSLATVWAIASAGVDAIAVGALTHSAPALDIGLDFLPGAGGGDVTEGRG